MLVRRYNVDLGIPPARVKSRNIVVLKVASKLSGAVALRDNNDATLSGFVVNDVSVRQRRLVDHVDHAPCRFDRLSG